MVLATQGYGQSSTIATQGYGQVLFTLSVSFYNVDTVFSIEPDTPYEVDVVIMKGAEVAYRVSAVLSLDGLIEEFADLVFRVNVERERFRTIAKR